MKWSIFAPIFLLSSQAWAVTVPVANDPKGLVKHLEITGCGEDIQARIENGPADSVLINRNLVLDFGELYLAAEDHQSSLACLIDADIQIGAGLKFRINEGVIQGYASGQGLQGSVAFDYNFPETGDASAVDRDLYVTSNSKTEDFSLIAKIMRPRFTSCSNQPQIFRLSGSVYLDLKNSPTGSAEIRITGNQQTADTQKYGVGWHWSCQKCD